MTEIDKDLKEKLQNLGSHFYTKASGFEHGTPLCTYLHGFAAGLEFAQLVIADRNFDPYEAKVKK